MPAALTAFAVAVRAMPSRRLVSILYVTLITALWG